MKPVGHIQMTFSGYAYHVSVITRNYSRNVPLQDACAKHNYLVNCINFIVNEERHLEISNYEGIVH
jgi:hypothetical protein